MNKVLSIYFVLMTMTFSCIALADGEATRLTNPNAMSIEVLGRGLRYSVDYDRALNDDFVAGFGFGSSLINNDDGTDTDLTAKMIPIYLNYNFLRMQGTVFATGGVDFVLNPRDVENRKAALSGLKMSSAGVIPVFGLGYENRGDFGFLFRMTAYALVDRTIAPWVGFSFGYAF